MTKKNKVNLKEIFLGLQTQMTSRLTLNRKILTHPVTKGDASELEWVGMLNTYLPKRYQVDKAFVVDHTGAVSEQIDIVVFDRHFSPFLLQQNGATYVPAESVYAVIEVKPRLSPETIRYAAEKAASVRRLVRTSERIVHAGGVVDAPKKPFNIQAGIVTIDGSLTEEGVRVLLELEDQEQLQFGCSLESGAFRLDSDDGDNEIKQSAPEEGFISFFLDLVATLQGLGSVPAIKIGAYAEHLHPHEDRADVEQSSFYVFGYGSLMWDEWEIEFGCTDKQVATLTGFKRDFNKASVRNWGTSEKPGPTLGLERSDGAECRGMVFEFPAKERTELLAELKRREGPSFQLDEGQRVVLASGDTVEALVPMNDVSADTYVGDKTFEERARMAREARGKNGSCIDYVTGIRDKLKELGIQDHTVELFAALVMET